MKRIIIFFIAVFYMQGYVTASVGAFEVKGNYFIPSEQAFKDIYGGGFAFGAEVSFKIWNNLHFWADGRFLSRKGELTFTKEETKLQIIPIGFGLKYFLTAGTLQFYGGIGGGYFIFKESNVIGDVSKDGFGFITRIGVLFQVTDSFFFDLFGNYSNCKMHPADFSIDIGGIEAGIGAGFKF
ncbi:MAG: hypothetical protein KKD59_08160 [Acidobacteria bacterium]|nr:hypothetical protein [Acidobacteriota bacterium]